MMPSEHLKLRAEQVKQLYSLESVGLIATVVNSSILTAVLYNAVSRHLLVLWISCLFVATSVRYLLLRRYQDSHFAPADPEKWGKLFIGGAALSGSLWGFAGIFLFPHESFALQVFLAFILGGMVAGAAAAYSALMGAFLAYSVPSLIPIAMQFLIAGSGPHIAMGTMTVLFGILMTATAKRINTMTITSLHLRFENASLISYLADAKEKAENVNEKLTAEILERQRAEEELTQHREHLEHLVKERTGELSATNERLIQEAEVRKRAEEALRENEQRYRELADLLPQPVFEMDLERRVTFANRAALECFGYTQRDLDSGLNAYQMLIAKDRERAMENTRRRLAGEGITGAEYTAQRKDGSQFPILAYASPIVRGNQLSGVRGIVVDLTERKKTEQDLLKSQKLESLGVLAGGLAHDFNNVLTVIMGNVSLAKMYTQANDRIFQRLAQTEAACIRAREITQQLLTFSRGGAPIKRVIFIADPLRDAVFLALRGSNARCEFAVADDLWPVDVDEGQFALVIHNLTVNARQAMPEGGTVEVRAANIVIDHPSASSIAPGDYVRISVEDHGIGIAQEHLPRVFDPYFTTKQSGSGLGLAAAYSIIHHHGGSISVESEPGVGTAFHVVLPAAKIQVLESLPEESELTNDGGRILVMDDEEMVREIAGRMLVHIGYEAAYAADGAEALKMYRNALEAGKPFSAVIMDLTVPGGMGGKEAIAGLLELDPNARAIVSSGYSNDPILSRFRDYGFRGVVAKPYRIEELSKTLRDVIRGV